MCELARSRSLASRDAPRLRRVCLFGRLDCLVTQPYLMAMRPVKGMEQKNLECPTGAEKDRAEKSGQAATGAAVAGGAGSVMVSLAERIWEIPGSDMVTP